MIYLASKGITLINAATEEDVTEAVTSDPMKKALVAMQGIFAELEKNLLVKKLKMARDRKKALTGKCEGAPSYEEAMPGITDFIKQCRGEGMTFPAIAERLNGNEVATAKGRKWTGQLVQNVLRKK